MGGLSEVPECIGAGEVMTTTITVKVIYETDQEADAFVDAIEALDYDGMFPTGASVQREVK